MSSREITGLSFGNILISVLFKLTGNENMKEIWEHFIETFKLKNGNKVISEKFERKLNVTLNNQRNINSETIQSLLSKSDKPADCIVYVDVSISTIINGAILEGTYEVNSINRYDEFNSEYPIIKKQKKYVVNVLFLCVC